MFFTGRSRQTGCAVASNPFCGFEGRERTHEVPACPINIAATLRGPGLVEVLALSRT